MCMLLSPLTHSVPGGPRVGFGHIFQSLNFNHDGSVQNPNCAAVASFLATFDAGCNGGAATGLATKTTDASPALAVYNPVCDSDLWTLYQTWQSSKSGTLASVSINIAASVQTTNLTINLFKFSFLTQLVAPEYKYTLLASVSVPRSALTYVFDAYTVSVHAKVNEGDMLGVSIAATGFCAVLSFRVIRRLVVLVVLGRCLLSARARIVGEGCRAILNRCMSGGILD